MQHKEDTHHLAPFTPKGDARNLNPGTWYLTGIDDMYRRKYEKAGQGTNGTSWIWKKETFLQTMDTIFYATCIEEIFLYMQPIENIGN